MLRPRLNLKKIIRWSGPVYKKIEADQDAQTVLSRSAYPLLPVTQRIGQTSKCFLKLKQEEHRLLLFPIVHLPTLCTEKCGAHWIPKYGELSACTCGNGWAHFLLNKVWAFKNSWNYPSTGILSRFIDFHCRHRQRVTSINYFHGRTSVQVLLCIQPECVVTAANQIAPLQNKSKKIVMFSVLSQSNYVKRQELTEMHLDLPFS